MPSFLSRLLGRKKPQEQEPSADNPGHPAPLLDGKFEAISPNVSPSAALFTDPAALQIRGNERPKDKESPFHIFRARSRPSSDLPTVGNPAPDVPHLSINLPVTKDRGRALDVVFECDPQALVPFDETAIGERRLTPHEALSLVRACSQAIIERGLESLGVMHPHWHSASPEVQHRLVSLYLLSLASASPNEPTSPVSPNSPIAFESQLHYTRSSHDIAAVLRWGLRHLKLDGDSFGKESGDWTWYNTFAAAERADSYPPDAFSKSLIPQLPTTHAQLLLATLDIISSLSARSEANGSSGSKLSKLFGLWLLTSEPAVEGDNWIAFYDRWDRAGRILEHFNDAQRLPRRLTDLVEHYPYNSGVDAPKDDLLPPPRFSTRQYDALLVRLDTEYSGPSKPKSHPLRLIADALRAESTSEAATTEDDDGVWNAIKKASLTFDAPEVSTDAALTEPIPIFSNVFSDESVRLLSLIPVDVSDRDKSAPTFALHSPISSSRPRSFSLPETPLSPDQADRSRSSQSGHPLVAPGLTMNISTAPTTSIPETPTDWSRFSNQGFGTIPGSRDLVATLWDNDVEVTAPPPAPLSRKSSRRARSRHSSVDSARTPLPPPPAVPAPPISKTTLITKVTLDEAFIDFWADSLLDPVSKRWPRFVLCQLKALPSAATSSTPTPAWLVIEQRFLRLAPVSLVKEEIEPAVPPARPRPSSPRPESSRLSAAFSIASKKRFAFFTGGSSDPKSPKEKSARLPQVGEFGEGVNGTGNGAATATPAEKLQETSAKGGEGATLAATTVSTTAVAAVGAAAAAVAATREEITQAPKEDDGLPTRTLETAPSEPTPKADEPVKDEPPHGIPTQNGVARDESETTAVEGPAGADAAVIPPVMKEPAKSEVELPIPGADAETAQREPASVPTSDSARVGEGAIAQVEAAPAEPDPVPRESGAVVELSSPEPSVVPVVEEAIPTGEKDAPTLEAPTSASAITMESTTVAAESAPVQAPAPEPSAAAIEEPVAGETVVPKVADLDPAVEPKATIQDLPADEATPDTEQARASEEVPAPAAKSDLVSEAPEGSLSEDESEDLPLGPVPQRAAPGEFESSPPRAAPTRVPEIVVPFVNVKPRRKPVPTDDTAPTIQKPTLDESQAAGSTDAVQTARPLEEPASVADEPTIEGTQPTTVPERNDTILGEPDDVEATPSEPVTEPFQVVNDTAFLAAENLDPDATQAPSEAPAPSAEPDTEHAAVVTQSTDEGLPSQGTPGVQDLVVEEEPTAEETTTVLDASASKSLPADDLSASHEEEIVVGPAESAVTEDTPTAAPLLGGPPSGDISPEGPEQPVTEPAPEPSTANAQDSAHSHMNGELLITGSVDEVSVPTAEASNMAEPQTTINDLEGVLPAEEPSAPAPETSASIVEEPVSSIGVEIPLETLASVAEEAGSTTEETAPAGAETPVPAAQEPVSEEETAPEVAESTMEAPTSVPAEPDLTAEEAVPAATDAPEADPVPAIEEPTPITQGAPTEDHGVSEPPAPVPEELTPREDAAPAAAEDPTDPALAPDEPASVTEAVTLDATEAPASSSPVPDEPTFGTEVTAPDSEAPTDPADPTPVPDEPALVTEVTAPASETPTDPADPAPIPDEPALVTEAIAPAPEVPTDPIPVPSEPIPVIEAAAPPTAESPADPTPGFEEPAPVTEAAASATPEAPANPTPVPEEPAPVPETATPAVPEAPSDPAPVPELGPGPAPGTETAPPATEIPTTEQSAPDLVETPAPDEPASASALQDDQPAVSEPPVENSAPGAEESVPVTESAVPTAGETPAEAPEHAAEGLPNPETATAAVEEIASTADAFPAAGEQVAQESAAHSSSEAIAIATNTQESSSPPAAETTVTSESVALVAAPASGVATTGPADTSSDPERKHEFEPEPEPEPEPATAGEEGPADNAE